VAANEDEPQLRRLSSLVDRLAATQVERVVAEVFEEVQQRALPMVRGILLEELVRRLTDEDSDAHDEVEEVVVEPPRTTVEEELAGLERELEELVATGGGQIPEGRSLYVYAVVPSADARRAVLPEGVVHGRPVETIEEGELAAVVSRVDASRISARAADAEAVAALAHRHDDVLTTLAEQATIVPFRLGTVCASADDVRRMLATERDRLYELVNELYERDEFGVQIVVAPEEHEAAENDDVDEAAATYLQRKVDERREAEQRSRDVEDAADAIHERLAAIAVRWQEVPMRSRRPELVSNCSYLVDRRRADEFLAAADRLRVEHVPIGLGVRITGPWPPYSFTSRDTDHPDG
jgi:gas vesicle protein GvpL/GvpF